MFNPKKYVKTPYNPDPCPQCKRDGYSSYITELTCSKLELSEKTIDIMFKKHPLEDLFSEYLSVYGSMGFVVIGGRSYDIATTVEWGAEFGVRLCYPPVTDEELKKIAQLTNLTSLDLDYNQISDITPLAKLTNLTSLYLGDNQISDITPLTKLTNLTSLNLRGNQISDITPLTKLMNLGWLDLGDNDKINYKQIEKLKVQLPNTYILL